MRKSESLQYSANTSRAARTGIVVAIALFLFYAWMLCSAFRFASPLVIADEFWFLINGIYYQDLDRLHLDHPEAPRFGTSFFLWAIHRLSRIHGNTDDLVKLFNVGTSAVAVISFMLLARYRLLSHSMWLGAVLLVTPVVLFSSYVMPDMLYSSSSFALMAIFLACVSFRRDIRLSFIVLGAGVAVLCFIKPHGLFVLVSVLASAILAGIDSRLYARCAVALLCFGLGFSIFLFLMGAAFSPKGQFDINFVGQFYTGTITGTGVNVFTRLPGFMALMTKQLAAVMLLVTPTVTSLLYYIRFRIFGILLRRPTQDSVSDDQSFIDTFVATFPLVTLSLIVAAVSWIYYMDPSVLHFRYFGFGITLSLLAVCWLEERHAGTKALTISVWRCASASLWAVATLLFYAMSGSIRLLPVFNPEVFFAYNDREFGSLNLLGPHGSEIGLAVVLCGALLLALTRIGWVKIQCGVLIVLFAVSSYNVSKWQEIYPRHLAFYRTAGDVAQSLCGGKGEPILALATPEDVAAHAMALFRVFGPSQTSVTPPGEKPTIGLLRGAKCVVSFMDISDLGYQKLESEGGYSLFFKP